MILQSSLILTRCSHNAYAIRQRLQKIGRFANIPLRLVRSVSATDSLVASICSGTVMKAIVYSGCELRADARHLAEVCYACLTDTLYTAKVPQ